MEVNLNRGKAAMRPVALVCYICGREYGTLSLEIHIKSCIKKWDIEQEKLPKAKRRPCPQPPNNFNQVRNDQLEFQVWKAAKTGQLTQKEKSEMMQAYNNEAFNKWDTEALLPCKNCQRTFLPDRLIIHNKSCLPGRPLKMRIGVAQETKATATTTKVNQNSNSKLAQTQKRSPNIQENTYRETFFTSDEEDDQKGFKIIKRYNPKEIIMTETDEEEEEIGNLQFSKTLKTAKRAQPSRGFRADARNSFETDYITHTYQQHETQYQVANGGPRNKIVKVNENNGEFFPCRFCEKMLAPGKIFQHETKCDLKPKKLILFEHAPIRKPVEKQKWRNQSNQLQAAIKAARFQKSLQAQGYDAKQIAQMVPPVPSLPDERILCPYCNRKFAQLTAERHIPVCKNTINKPKGPPIHRQIDETNQSRSTLLNGGKASVQSGFRKGILKRRTLEDDPCEEDFDTIGGQDTNQTKSNQFTFGSPVRDKFTFGSPVRDRHERKLSFLDLPFEEPISTQTNQTNESQFMREDTQDHSPTIKVANRKIVVVRQGEPKIQTPVLRQKTPPNQRQKTPPAQRPKTPTIQRDKSPTIQRSKTPEKRNDIKSHNQPYEMAKAIRPSTSGNYVDVQTRQALYANQQCPHCLRNFNRAAAERHIPVCVSIKNKPPTLAQKQAQAQMNHTKNNFNPQSPRRLSPLPVKSTDQQPQQIKVQQYFPIDTEDSDLLIREALSMIEDKSFEAKRTAPIAPVIKTVFKPKVVASSRCKFCTQCGRPFRENDKFCGGCANPRV